jgi:hypothetical protein
MVRGKMNSVHSERMQTGLNYVSNWCEEANLRIYPNKTVVITFTNLVMRGVTFEYSRVIKYLESV